MGSRLKNLKLGVLRVHSGENQMSKITIDELKKIKNIKFLENIEYLESFKNISIDSRTIKKDELFFAIKGERFDGHNFLKEVFGKGAYGAVVEKKYTRKLSENFEGCRLFLVDDTLKALQELAYIHRKSFKIPVIAVTGTNGKTTTKEMTFSVLLKKYNTLKNQGNLNNHIGVPLTLLNIDEKCQVAVVEIGASHPGEIRLLCEIAQPEYGIITNVSRAHLQFFGTVEKVAETKAELLEYVNKRGTAIINGDDILLMKYKKKADKVLTFGLNENFDIFAKITNVDQYGCCQFRLNGKITINLKIPGKVNIYNSLAASAVGLLMNIPYEEIKDSLENFKAENQRLETIQNKGITIINDSYNANPDSMKMAILVLKDFKPARTIKRIAVLGDMLELGDYSEEEHTKIGEYVFNSNIDALFTFGTYSEYISKQAKSLGMKNSEHFKTKEKIAEKLNNVLRNNDVVLLKGSRGMRMEDILKIMNFYN